MENLIYDDDELILSKEQMEKLQALNIVMLWADMLDDNFTVDKNLCKTFCARDSQNEFYLLDREMNVISKG